MGDDERSVWTGDRGVLVHVESPTRRDVPIGADRAPRVPASGEPVPTAPTPAARMRRESARIGRWVLALTATAVLTEYVATRFSDHQQAVQIRANVIEAINAPSVRVYNDALDVVSAAVQQNSEVTLRAQRNRVVNAWIEASATVDATVFVHFQHTAAKRDWHRFQRAVYELVALSHPNGHTQAAAHAAQLRGFLRAHGSGLDSSSAHWRALLCRAAGCRATLDWYEGYRWLGDQVMGKRGAVMLRMLRSDVENLG